MVCASKQQFVTSLSGEQRDFIDAAARNGSVREHDSSGPRETDFRSGGLARNTRAGRHSITRLHVSLCRTVTGGHPRILERVR